MKGVKSLALFIAVAFLAFSCGGSDNKSPTSSGGVPSSSGSIETHASAPNTAVTAQNVQQVSQIVNTKAWEVFGEAATKIKTAKPSAGTTMTLDGKVDGLKSGYAQVKGTMTYTMSGQTTVTATNFNFICTYYNFSDDDQLWLGGAITYTGKLDMTDMQNLKYDLTFKGGFKFNGTYEGTQDFTTTYTMTGQNFSWTSTTSTTSGGKTFSSTTSYPI